MRSLNYSRYEAGGIAHHSQATTMPVVASNGRHITWDDIVPNLILEPDIHFCPTRLICLENTLQGMVFPQEEIVKISENAKDKGIAMHVRRYISCRSDLGSSSGLQWLHTVSRETDLG